MNKISVSGILRTIKATVTNLVATKVNDITKGEINCLSGITDNIQDQLSALRQKKKDFEKIVNDVEDIRDKLVSTIYYEETTDYAMHLKLTLDESKKYLADSTTFMDVPFWMVQNIHGIYSNKLVMGTTIGGVAGSHPNISMKVQTLYDYMKANYNESPICVCAGIVQSRISYTGGTGSGFIPNLFVSFAANYNPPTTYNSLNGSDHTFYPLGVLLSFGSGTSYINYIGSDYVPNATIVNTTMGLVSFGIFATSCINVAGTVNIAITDNPNGPVETTVFPLGVKMNVVNTKNGSTGSLIVNLIVIAIVPSYL